VYHNNPIVVADLERKHLWPTEGYNTPDFVLSIRTSYSPNSARKLNHKPSIGLFGHAKDMANIAMDHIRSSLDSEKAWTDYILRLPENQKPRYQRINPELSEDPPALDDVYEMQSLQETIRAQMTGHPNIANAAHQLVATTFYVEKTTSVKAGSDGTFECSGMIHIYPILYSSFNIMS
jgi:hypothetical protein